MKALRSSLAVAVLLASASVASAVTYTLEQIYNDDVSGCGDGCLQIDDKYFTNIVFGGDEAGVDPSTINVTGTVEDGYVVITFNKNWTAAVDEEFDFTIEYTVATVSGEALIDSIDQQITGTSGIGGGYITLAESVTAGGEGVGSSNLLIEPPVNDVIDPNAEVNDILNLIDGPYSTVDVRKDVAIVGGTTEGCVDPPCTPTRSSLSIISQSFHQIPEPGTIFLLGSGLLGLAGVGRRRAKRS